MIAYQRPISITQSGYETTPHGTHLFPIGFYENDLSIAPSLWHWHEEIELIQTIKGTTVLQVEGTSYLLHENESCLINSGMIHEAQSGGAGSNVVRTAVFHGRLIAGDRDSIFWQRYLKSYMGNAAYACLPICTGSPELMETDKMMSRLFALSQAEPFGYEFEVRSLLSDFLCKYLSRLTGEVRENQGGNRRNARVKTMLSFIQQHYSEPISTGDIAKAASISDSECLRSFNEILGTTPIQYLKKLRLQVAAECLRTSGDSITEIAMGCGFQQMSYFTRAFRLCYGTTPSQYRDEQTENGQARECKP